jgi:ubiquinone/menaquinone biosynthesis C-methylase UbiE
MQATRDSLFDGIAEAYYKFTPILPEKYVDLLQETCNLTANDTIIDLGCGSGDLVLSLAKYSSFVQGIDESKTMINMAKEKDTHKKATWIHQSVTDFDLGEEKYNLIISFESFHLFPNTKALMKRCARALKPGGALCIGWATYEWEVALRNIITETLNHYGKDWNYEWTLPNFSELVAEVDLSSPQQNSVTLEARTPIKTIIEHLSSESYAALLSDAVKRTMSQELLKKFTQVYPSGESVGASRYTIMYAQKQTG